MADKSLPAGGANLVCCHSRTDNPAHIKNRWESPGRLRFPIFGVSVPFRKVCGRIRFSNPMLCKMYIISVGIYTRPPLKAVLGSVPVLCLENPRGGGRTVFPFRRRLQGVPQEPWKEGSDVLSEFRDRAAVCADPLIFPMYGICSVPSPLRFSRGTGESEGFPGVLPPQGVFTEHVPGYAAALHAVPGFYKRCPCLFGTASGGGPVRRTGMRRFSL